MPPVAFVGGSAIFWNMPLQQGRISTFEFVEEAVATGQAVQIIDVSEHQPRRIPSAKWRELIKKVWEADPLL